MATDRDFQELVARCVAIMVAYHGAGRSRQATTEMRGEVHEAARQAMSLGHRAEEIIRRILHPTEEELLVRYGYEAGARINAAFLDAFEEEADLRIDGRGRPLSPRPALEDRLSSTPIVI